MKKPSNIFIDSEGNIRLGDFGLATVDKMNSGKEMNSKKQNHSDEEDDASVPESSKYLDEISDIRELLGKSATHATVSIPSESITVGVGTTYYRAPEQELANRIKGNKKAKDSGYDVMADIYSFGIVLFEMFHPPFQTGMERFNVLTTLRQDNIKSIRNNNDNKDNTSTTSTVDALDSFSDKDNDSWKHTAAKRFPAYFIESTPDKAQRMILWCLEHSPSRRPSASDLLTVRLLREFFSFAYQILTNNLFISITKVGFTSS